MTRRTLLLALAQQPPREIRLISAAPSPYTRRRDSYRAGHGILACLRRLIEEHSFPLTTTYYDATPHLGKPDPLKRLVSSPPTLLIGTSVWAQGPSSVSRGFFEAINTHSLAGQSASTWVTSGGAHTGAALAFDSNLSTLRSMGAAVFAFGQKQMVFTTDERLTGEKPGEFSLLDLWFMEGLAKAAIVQTLAPGQPAEARALYTRLNSDPAYYLKHFPKSNAELEPRFILNPAFDRHQCPLLCLRLEGKPTKILEDPAQHLPPTTTCSQLLRRLHEQLQPLADPPE